MMVLDYDTANCNRREAACLYEQRYLERLKPHHTIFASIYCTLRERGNLKRSGGVDRGGGY